MPEEHIELERRFQELSNVAANDPTMLEMFSRHGTLSWEDLLKHRRVVVLAEAGSGKSAELKARHKAIVAAGGLACFTTVQSLATRELEAAVTHQDRVHLNGWRESSTDTFFFFVDSVDEAKDAGLSLSDALRSLANAIAGREERAHVIISGRYTDWDPIEDRRLVDEALTIPGAPPDIRENGDLLGETLGIAPSRPEEPAKDDEKAFVVVMSQLEAPDVQRFAEFKKIDNTGAFLTAIAEADLWRFARRPLDLDWMAEFWRRNGCFGTLAEMLQQSVDARLVERKRRPGDALTVERGKEGIHRIAAGMAFCGFNAVRVPTEGFRGGLAENSLAVEGIMPDWTAAEIRRLLSRPVFDPATLGRARFHNDNEGTLRAYLTARWMDERRAHGCPDLVLDDLLFADMYGVALVRPDMLDVAVWLALRNHRIAEKLITREPIALIARGDPGSLAPSLRTRAFAAVLSRMDEADRQNYWNLGDPLKRLAHPDFDPLLEPWWDEYQGNADAQRLILQLALNGRQLGGLAIARRVFQDSVADETCRVLAAQIVIEMGSTDDRRSLARYLLEYAATLPRSVILFGLGGLFPEFIPVEGFFALIDAATTAGRHDTLHPVGPELDPRLRGEAELGAFVVATTERLGPLDERDGDHGAELRTLTQMAVTAATRLLDRHADLVPNIVTDFVLRLRGKKVMLGVDPERDELSHAIVASPSRRRSSFWRAAEVLRAHPWAKQWQQLNLLMVQHLGWPGTFEISDFEWLLEDVRQRIEADDRRLAFEGAYSICRAATEEDLFDRLAAAVDGDEVLSTLLTTWRLPHVESAADIEMRENIARRRANHEKEKAEQHSSWLSFIDDLRANPSQLDRLQPQTERTADRRLIELWNLLTWRLGSRSSYAISTLRPLEPILGAEVTARLQKALIAFAYARMPLLPSERPADRRNLVSNFDTMGVVGISLAASTTPHWVENLSDAQVNQAARYAVLELNGFPPYLVELAAQRPEHVRAVLLAEINAQLESSETETYGMLDRLAHASGAIAAIVIADLLDIVETQAGSLLPASLRKIVDAVIVGLPTDASRFAERFRRIADLGSDAERLAYLLQLAFAVDGDTGVDLLRQKMAVIDRDAQTMLCSVLLPRLFGSRFRGPRGREISLTFPKLLELVVIAFEGVRPAEDISHPSGEVFSPGLRDDAQDARYAVFRKLETTPGEATHAALLRFAQTPGFPMDSGWLRTLARRRASHDAALPAWRPEDIGQFEAKHDKPPATTEEFRLLALRRLEQVEHDALHGQFSQSTTLQGQPDENAVQRWIGNDLERLQSIAFTVVRETHVAGEKEPDITLIGRALPLRLPIEIKVVDGMTVAEMELALVDQLCGKYLRHRDARHGILLFVSQRERAQGWQLDGHAGPVDKQAVLRHLNDVARRIREASSDGPQPSIACIDVSSAPSLVRTPTRTKGNAKASTTSKSPRKRKTQAGAMAPRKRTTTATASRKDD